MLFVSFVVALIRNITVSMPITGVKFELSHQLNGSITSTNLLLIISPSD